MVNELENANEEVNKVVIDETLEENIKSDDDIDKKKI